MIRKSTIAVTLKKLLGAAAVGATLCAASAAQAGVLDFETPVDTPFVFAGDVLNMGSYYVEGAGLPGFVGSIDANDACAGPQCPVNNPTHYYSALADSYMFFGMLDHSGFTIGSLDASFIGGGVPTYPAVAALLYLTAFNAAGSIVDEIYLNLAGPIGGSFNFASYDLTGFGGGGLFTDVRIASYACDAAGNCNRNTNQAQFAIDNIVTINASDVPEPGTFALMGLGLLGLLARVRPGARRNAA
jgi:hypothetical protein